MKIPFEPPDLLMRKVKMRAAETDRTHKDLIAGSIPRGFALGDDAAAPERLDLTQFIGAAPHYLAMEQVADYTRQLRQDRAEAA